VELTAVAQEYVDRWLPGPGEPVAERMRARLRSDEAYCRRVAGYFEHAPRRDLGERLARRYVRFTRENLRQYQAIRDAGITVRPWLAGGQPYRGSAELRAAVRERGVLHVHLTRAGHGPGPVDSGHPLLGASGIVVDGVELCHNDVFRVVHDVFGHVMTGRGFSARGELAASYCHLRMYSENVHPVVFTEQIAQICWYFYGPHATGERRYPEQKVFEFPRPFLDAFTSLFDGGERA
jgi:hypothetical protein